MITVKTEEVPGHSIQGFLIEGHADYQEGHEDYDIVCASVSAISLTAAVGLRDVLKRKGTYQTRPGRLEVHLQDEPDAQTDAVIRTMMAGIAEIQKQFPGRIQMENQCRKR